MRRYFLVLAGLLVLVAFLGIPPRPYVRWWRPEERRTEERKRANQLLSDLVLEDWLYQRIQWRDSIADILHHTDPSTTPFVAGLPENTPDSLRDRLDQGIRSHLADIGVTEPKTPIGVFLVPRDRSGSPDGLVGRHSILGSRREFYVARGEEEPFCALVEAVDTRGTLGTANTLIRLVRLRSDTLARPNTLRICAYYARYGRPGPQVEGWLRTAGFAFGQGVDRRLDELQMGVGQPLRWAFGLYNPFTWISETGYSCMAGREAACRQAFFGRPDDWGGYYFRNSNRAEFLQHSPVDFLTTRWYAWGNFGGMDGHIFTILEEEFGAQRFQRFWSSDLPVDQAFQSAFGLPAEVWIRDWAQGLFGTLDPGPGVPLNASLLSLLTIGLLGALGLVIGHRRG